MKKEKNKENSTPKAESKGLDKVLVTVRRLQNTPEGFKEVAMSSLEWDAKPKKALRQYQKISRRLMISKWGAQAKCLKRP